LKGCSEISFCLITEIRNVARVSNHRLSAAQYQQNKYARYCEKTVLSDAEEVKWKTKAHRGGFAYTIPQEALPAKRAEQLENIT